MSSVTSSTPDYISVVNEQTPYRPIFADITGGNRSAAMVLSLLVQLDDEVRKSRQHQNGWIFKRAEHWTLRLAVSESTIQRGKAILKKIGLCETRDVTPNGCEAPINMIRLNRELLNEMIHVQASSAEYRDVQDRLAELDEECDEIIANATNDLWGNDAGKKAKKGKVTRKQAVALENQRSVKMTERGNVSISYQINTPQTQQNQRSVKMTERGSQNDGTTFGHFDRPYIGYMQDISWTYSGSNQEYVGTYIGGEAAKAATAEPKVEPESKKPKSPKQVTRGERARAAQERVAKSKKNAEVTKFIKLFEAMATEPDPLKCLPLNIKPGINGHAVEYFGAPIKARIAETLDDYKLTPEQLIESIKVAVNQLICSEDNDQWWRMDDDRPYGIPFLLDTVELYPDSIGQVLSTAPAPMPGDNRSQEVKARLISMIIDDREQKEQLEYDND